MRIRQSNSRHGIQRLYYLALVFVILVFAIAGSSCGTEKSVKILGLGDTPIIISGGSIHLDFPTGSGGFGQQQDGSWLYAGNALDNGVIFNSVSPQSKDLDLSASAGNCEIVVYRTDGQLRPMVTITSTDDGGGNRTVKIVIGKYEGKDELVPRPGKPGHYFSPSSIAQVTVTNKKSGAVTPINSASGLPAEGKLTMYLYGKL